MGRNVPKAPPSYPPAWLGFLHDNTDIRDEAGSVKEPASSKLLNGMLRKLSSTFREVVEAIWGE